MKETREQLNQLIHNLYDRAEAEIICREIEEADATLSSFQTPRPRPEFIEEMKRSMLRRSAAIRRKTVYIRTLLIGAAACLLIAAGLFWGLQTRTPTGRTADAIVDVQEFFSDETTTAIASDLDEISSQIYAVEVSGQDGLWEEESAAVQEIEEMELLLNTNFWKG